MRRDGKGLSPPANLITGSGTRATCFSLCPQPEIKSCHFISCLERSEQQPVSFAFGPRHADWEAVTVYVTLANRRFLTACPVLPHKRWD